MTRRTSSIGDILMGPESPHFGALLGARDDEAARERYRAFLVEQRDERAELFVIEQRLLSDDEPERDALIARAKTLLATNGFFREWWRLVTRTGPIRNCGAGPSAEPRPVRFAYECPRSWDSLSPTKESGARHCSTCTRMVYLCRSAEEAEARAHRGECVTIPSTVWRGVAQEATRHYTGRPDPVAIWADRVFPGERRDE